jgi:hypothetical protein
MHKQFITLYNILKGVEQALKDIIIKAVKGNFLLKIEDETLGLLDQTLRSMITHLRNQGRVLNLLRPRLYLPKQTNNGMQVRFPHYTSTEWKRQLNNSLALGSPQT